MSSCFNDDAHLLSKARPAALIEKHRLQQKMQVSSLFFWSKEDCEALNKSHFSAFSLMQPAKKGDLSVHSRCRNFSFSELCRSLTLLLRSQGCCHRTVVALQNGIPQSCLGVNYHRVKQSRSKKYNQRHYSCARGNIPTRWHGETLSPEAPAGSTAAALTVWSYLPSSPHTSPLFYQSAFPSSVLLIATFISFCPAHPLPFPSVR